MQAVILAGGEGTRLRPLTLSRPKSLVEVGGRPILEHIIDALPSEVDEVILVVGYKAEQIQEHFGDEYRGRRIRYVFQWMPAGTAHALSIAAPFLKNERFFVLCGDDIHGPEALMKALKYPYAILATEHPEPSKFGVISLADDGTLESIIEKPKNPPTNLISTGALLIDKNIFKYPSPRHENGEYFITDPFGDFAKDYPVHVVTQDEWYPVGYPEDIPRAEEYLRTKKRG